MLATLARTATRRPVLVLLVWLLLLVVGFGFGTRVFGDLNSSVEDVPGSESAVTSEVLGPLTPDGESFTASVTGGTDGSVRAQEVRAAVADAVADVRGQKGVDRVADPYTAKGLLAEDGKVLLIPVTLEGDLSDRDEIHAVNDAADRLREIAGAAGDRVDVAVSGDPLLGDQMGGRAQEDVARAELITLPAVLLVLLLIFGGLRAAGLPLLVAVSGVAGAFLTLFAFSQFTEISVYAVQVVTMLGLGLAVDYALLMVVRFREERGHERDVVRAVHATVAHAGRTVLFSGLTVAVCLSGLVWFPSPFLRSMGLAAGAVVVVDMLAALTLLPALLALFGGKLTPRRTKSRLRKRPAEPGALFARLARFAARRPYPVLVAVVAGLAVLALPVLGMRIEIGDARQLPHDTEARQLYDAVHEHFPAGTDVNTVDVVIRPGADPAYEREIRALSEVTRSSSDRLPNGTTLVRLTPTGSADGPEATALVERVRELRGDEPAKVTGTAARLVDFREMLADRAPWAVLTVLVGLFALLFAFTGSLLSPLRTLLTTLLSLGAGLGVVTWVFQDGHGASLLGGEGLGALSLTAPPLIIAIAFGLAMDYELFILSRMRESWEATGNAHEAVVEGLRRSGRVVTCAALLLAIVFGGFMTGGFSPILQIGLGLTLAVLIDATIVRMLLVPAAMTLLGDRAWWAPPFLRRLHQRYGLSEAPATVAAERAAVGPGPQESTTTSMTTAAASPQPRR
ncbi:MMPL family transporter [Streptomyces sp. NRRL B-1347]|uniref:MMPL family transporter n=1 Tax=Streptomyces sp. NRRL B-1347 TaxID=1476877 RepID=UPI00099DFA06|nr:MMPL family transporter [Streptomyces sp. NRRL B-1347]